ncbi:MAG: hypothetical protein D6795_06135 [Deltaproteobacteria bacterium]|nr:MAG: hypothetical protein D6795_06135 [Deltaproteobacteria bacterium]
MRISLDKGQISCRIGNRRNFSIVGIGGGPPSSVWRAEKHALHAAEDRCVFIEVAPRTLRRILPEGEGDEDFFRSGCIRG